MPTDEQKQAAELSACDLLASTRQFMIGDGPPERGCVRCRDWKATPSVKQS